MISVEDSEVFTSQFQISLGILRNQQRSQSPPMIGCYLWINQWNVTFRELYHVGQSVLLYMKYLHQSNMADNYGHGRMM